MAASNIEELFRSQVDHIGSEYKYSLSNFQQYDSIYRKEMLVLKSIVQGFNNSAYNDRAAEIVEMIYKRQCLYLENEKDRKRNELIEAIRSLIVSYNSRIEQINGIHCAICGDVKTLNLYLFDSNVHKVDPQTLASLYKKLLKFERKINFLPVIAFIVFAAIMANSLILGLLIVYFLFTLYLFMLNRHYCVEHCTPDMKYSVWDIFSSRARMRVIDINANLSRIRKAIMPHA